MLVKFELMLVKNELMLMPYEHKMVVKLTNINQKNLIIETK